MTQPLSFALPGWFVLAVGAVPLLLAHPAQATVTQPDGTAMPQPANPMELSCCVVNRGFPAAADTLAGLFMYHELNGVAGGDTALDPTIDAHITPGTFAPQCGLSGTIVLHGGGCKNALGWYNATDPATVPKTVYPIVPANLTQPPPNGISCVAPDFCPLATRTTTQPNYTWADPLPDFAANIRNDPNWAGGQVGFALIGSANSGSGCTETKYSQADINDHSPAGGTTKGAPWITTLIYQSIADPNGYYIAFEDQPMCTASWRGCQPGSTMANTPGNGNDGDFNDFVFYVSGIDCAGGGQACDTGMPGICAGGTTQCSNGGMDIKCRQDIQPRAETCNLLDDDCDGIIDNPDAPGLCPTGEVCSQGVCINPCSNGEFPCAPPTVCDTTDGLCKDPRCMNANCAADQICDQGVCVGGCDGVVCPPGQVCRIGNCIDPCQGITCGDGQVCEGGACLAACGCRNCPDGKSCSSAGTCVDKGCDKVTCQAPMVCVEGSCVDGCAGVQCPAAQVCSNGQCAIPAGGIVIPRPDGGVSTTGTGGSPGTGGRTNTGGTTGAAGAPATGAGGTGSGGSMAREGGITTCNCEASSGPGASGVALLLASLGAASLRRRRRACSRDPRGSSRR